MKLKLSQRLAFCAVSSAASIVCLLATVFPYASYALAALAGIVLIPVTLELGTKYGVSAYFASAILALLITPDAEAKLLFVSFFGYYPVLQMRIDLWYSKARQWIVKLALFNFVAVVSFVLLITVFGYQTEEFEIFGIYIPPLLLLFGNVVFVIYDTALKRVESFYRVRLHPLVKRIF